MRRLLLIVGLVIVGGCNPLFAEEKVADEFSSASGVGLDGAKWNVCPTDRGRLLHDGGGYIKCQTGTEEPYDGMWWRPYAMNDAGMGSDDHWVELQQWRVTGVGSVSLFLRGATAGASGLDKPDSDVYWGRVYSDSTAGLYKALIVKIVDGDETVLASKTLTSGYFGSSHSLLFDVEGGTLRLRDKSGTIDLSATSTSISEGTYTGFQLRWRHDKTASARGSRFAAGVGMLPTGYGDDYEPLDDEWEVPEDSSMFGDHDLWLIYEELRKSRYYEDRGEMLIVEKLKEIKGDTSGIRENTSRMVEIMEDTSMSSGLTPEERAEAEGEHSEEATTGGISDAFGDGGAGGVFDFLPDVANGEHTGTFWFGLRDTVGGMPAFGIEANDPMLASMFSLVRTGVAFLLMLFLGWEAWHAALWTFTG